MKVIATVEGYSKSLEIVCFVTPAGAISQDRKDNHDQDRKEDDNDQDFNGGEQYAAQSDDGTK